MKGTRLGKYEIFDKLGEGGMGEVWTARDEQLNRSVAVKILPPEMANDSERRSRFQQEARALGALNHPNIVAVYDVGQDNGRAYIVSELVDGESLRTILDRGKLSLRKLIDIAVQIAEAMAAAHAVGIVHRDLKPENIMVTTAGRVKVLDFGLAKQTVNKSEEDAATRAITQAGTVMGTAGYMSPEQVRGLPTDHRSDIFSFGSVLYEMTTGKRAFHGPSSVETMNAILKEDPPPVEADVPMLPPALGTIVRRCQEKRPEQRFQSAADLAFALEAVAPTGSSGSRALPQPAMTRRPKWILPAALALLGIVLFAAGFLLRDRTLQRDPPRFQRITFRRGLVTNARFTSDGRNVVYGANWDGGPGRVFLAVPGNPESRDLDLPTGSLLLAVSSKDELAFLAGPFAPDGSGTLSRGSISGGQMRPWLEGVRAADWSPDGSSMAVLRSVNGKPRIEYPLGKVILNEPEERILAIRVSPDGTKIAYATFYQGSSIAIYVLDGDGKVQFLGVVSRQTSDVVDPFLSWSPNGKEIWFRSFDLQQWGTIYALDMKGRRRVITRVPGHATIYDVARDGRMLLRTDTRQVGILGMGPGDTVERDLSCLDASNLSGISDDGRVIAATIVGESGGPKGSVYLRKTDGSAPFRLGDGWAWAISPDGAWVSGFTSNDGAKRQYGLLPTGAGEERPIVIPALKDGGLVLGWLQHDQYLVIGQLPGKRMQCFAWDSNRKDLRAVCPEGIADEKLLLSPDRQWVVDKGPDDRYYAYPIAGGSPRIINGLTLHDHPVGWRADGHSLFVTTHHDVNKVVPVSVLDISTGQTTPWKDITPGRPVDAVSNLQITPDGRAYAYNFLVKLSDLYIADGVK